MLCCSLWDLCSSKFQLFVTFVLYDFHDFLFQWLHILSDKTCLSKRMYMCICLFFVQFIYGPNTFFIRKGININWKTYRVFNFSPIVFTMFLEQFLCASIRPFVDSEISAPKHQIDLGFPVDVKLWSVGSKSLFSYKI